MPIPESLDDLIARGKASATQGDAPTDYTANIDPENIWYNASFLADAREYLAERGYDVSTDEKVRDNFYELRNARDLNSVSLIKDAYEAATADEAKRARDRRLIQVFDALPGMFNSKSRWWSGEFGKALGDTAEALISDPLNLIPVGGPAAAAAAKTAIVSGGTVAKAVGRGVLASLPREIGFNAGIGAASDAVVQYRDNELGLQEGYDVGQALTSTGLAGLAGAAGAPLNAFDALSGVKAGRAQLAYDAARAAQSAAEAEARAAAEAAANAPVPTGPDGQFELDVEGAASAADPFELLKQTLQRELAVIHASERAKTDPELVAEYEDKILEVERAQLIPRVVSGLRRELDTLRAKEDFSEKDLARAEEIQAKIRLYETEYRDALNISTEDQADEFVEAQRLKRLQEFKDWESSIRTQGDLFEPPAEPGTPPVRSPRLDPEMNQPEPTPEPEVREGQFTPIQEPPAIDALAEWLDGPEGQMTRNPLAAGENVPVSERGQAPSDEPATLAEAMIRLTQMGHSMPEARKMVAEAIKGVRMDQQMDAVSRLLRDQAADDDVYQEMLIEIMDDLGEAFVHADAFKAYVTTSPKYRGVAERLTKEWEALDNFDNILTNEEALGQAGDMGQLENSGKSDYTRQAWDAVQNSGVLRGMTPEQKTAVGNYMKQIANYLDGDFRNVAQAERAILEGNFSKYKNLSTQGKVELVAKLGTQKAESITQATDVKGQPKARSGADSADGAVVQGDKVVSGRSVETEYSRGVPGTENSVTGGAKKLGRIQSILKGSRHVYTDEQGDERGMMAAVRTGKDAEKKADEQLKLAQMDALGIVYDSTQTGKTKRTTSTVTRSMIGMDSNGEFYLKHGDVEDFRDSEADRRKLLEAKVNDIRRAYDQAVEASKIDPKFADKLNARLRQLSSWKNRQIDYAFEDLGFEPPSVTKARKILEQEAADRKKPTGILGDAPNQRAAKEAEAKANASGGGKAGADLAARLEAIDPDLKGQIAANEARIAGTNRRELPPEVGDAIRVEEITQEMFKRANERTKAREAELRRQARKEGWSNADLQQRIREYHQSVYEQLERMISPEGRARIRREVEARRVLRDERTRQRNALEEQKRLEIGKATAEHGLNNDTAKAVRNKIRDYYDGLIKGLDTDVWEAETRVKLGFHKPIKNMRDLRNEGDAIDAELKGVLLEALDGRLTPQQLIERMNAIRERANSVQVTPEEPPLALYEDMINAIPEGYEGADPFVTADLPPMVGGGNAPSMAADAPVRNLPEPKIPEGRVLVLWHKTKPDWHRVGRPGQPLAKILGRSNLDDFIVGHGELKANAKGYANTKLAVSTFVPVDGTEMPKASLPKAIDAGDAGTVKHPVTGRDVPVSDLYAEIYALETRDWVAGGEAFKQHQEMLAKLYSAMPEYRLPNARRVEAMDQIAEVFKGSEPLAIMAVRDLVRRIGADIAPNFKRGNDGRSTFNPNTNTITIDPTSVNRGQIEDLIHEIAHWAYFNILSTDDRSKFWESMGKFYPNGNFDPNLVRKRLAVYDSEGNALRLNTNASSSAQEYFANQMVQHVLSNGKLLGSEGMWQKMIRVVRSIINRFFDKSLVDADLQPLFDKILPDEVADQLFRLPVKRAETNDGKRVEGQMASMSEQARALHNAVTRYSISSSTRADGDMLRKSLGDIVNRLSAMTPDLRLTNDTRAKIEAAITAFRSIEPFGPDGKPTLGFKYFEPAQKIEQAIDEVFVNLDFDFMRLEGSAPYTDKTDFRLSRVRQMNKDNIDWLSKIEDQIRDHMLRANKTKNPNGLAEAALLAMKTFWHVGKRWQFLDRSGEFGRMGGVRKRHRVLGLSRDLHAFMGYANMKKEEGGPISGDAWAEGANSLERGQKKAGDGPVRLTDADWTRLMEADAKADGELDVDEFFGMSLTVDPATMADSIALRWNVAGLPFEQQFEAVEPLMKRALAATRELKRTLETINAHATPEIVEAYRNKRHWKARLAKGRREYNQKRAAEAAIRKAAEVAEAPAAKVTKIADLSDRELWDRVKAASGGGDPKLLGALSIEVARRVRTRPHVEPVEMSLADKTRFKTMKGEELRRGLMQNLIKGNREEASKFKWEIWSRANKEGMKSLGNDGIPLIHPESKIVRSAIQREMDAMDGDWIDDIPPGVTPDVREVMLHMTHRDKAVQADMRRFLGRVLSLLGRNVKGDLANANIVSTDDIRRLTKGGLSDTAKAGFVDLRGPEFMQLRKDLRKITIGLNKETANPFDVVHEIGHMVYGSKLYTDEERAMIVNAFRSANDKRAGEVRAAYGDKPVEVQAAEWFSEGFAQYLAERVSRVDALDGLRHVKDGNWSGATMSRLEVLLDRMVEGFSYLVNGLMGRKDMRQLFRRATFYGDMQAPFRRPRPANGASVRPELARTHVQRVMAAEDMDRKAAIRRFTGDFGYNGGKEITFYHGTLHGGVFWDRNMIDPESLYDIHLKPSENGERGPGIYVTANPDVADWVYSKNVTGLGALEAFEDPSLYGHLTSGERRRVRALVEDLVDVRNEVAVLERMKRGEDYYDIMSDGQHRSGRANRIDNRYDVGDVDIAGLNGDIAAGYDQIAFLTDQIREITGGVEGEVLPLYIRAQKPLDLTQTFNLGRPEAQEILNAVMRSGVSENDILQGLHWRGYRTTEDLSRVEGSAFYEALAESIDWGGEGNVELNKILSDLGYDSIKDVQNNQLSDGTSVDHDVFVLFTPEQVKHMEADFFDKTAPGIFASDFHGRTMVGSMVNAAVFTNGPVNPQGITEIATLANAGGVPAKIANAMVAGARKVATHHHVENLSKVRSLVTLKGSVQYLRDVYGAHWAADKIAPVEGTGIRERMESERARKIKPIWDAMKEVEGVGGLKRWAKFVFGGGRYKQSDRVSQVVSALRRGDPTGLDEAQMRLYEANRRQFDEESENLRIAGSRVGRVNNYFPQVWNVEEILRDRGKFEEAIADYLVEENKRNAVNLSRLDAMTKAQKIAETLVNDNGVWTPPKAEQRNSAMGADHQRMLRLHEPWAGQHLRGLERFMDNNLMSITTRYFDESTRRAEVTREFGTNVHGFFDYMTVAARGESAVADLLIHDKVVYDRFKDVVSDGSITQGRIEIPLIHGFDNREVAVELAEQAIAASKAVDGRVEKIRAVTDVLMAAKPNAGEAYARRVEAIANALADFGGKPQPRDAVGYLEQVFRRLLHKPGTPGTAFYDAGHTASRAIKDFNNITLLSYTTLTSLSDVILPLVRSGNMRATVNAWRKYAGDPSYRQAFANVGASIDRIVTLFSHQAENGEPQFQLTNAFFEGIGLGKWTAVQREISTAVGFEAFADAQRVVQARHMKGGSSMRSRAAMRLLRRYGLEEFGLPNAPALRIDMTQGDARQTAQGKALNDALIRFANETIFEPDFADKPLWAQGPFGSIIFQLKSFPLMITRLSGYVLSENKQGNPMPLAYLMAAGGAAGAGTLAIKDVLQSRGGEDDKNMALRDRSLSKILEGMGLDPVEIGEDPDRIMGWLIEGWLLAGGFGLIANSLWDIAQQQDNGYYGITRAASVVFGPSVGVFADGMHVLAGTTNAFIQGEDDGTAKERQAVRSIAGRIPLVGGNLGVREAIVDTFGGEATGEGSSGLGGGFGGAWAGQWSGSWSN